MNKKSVVAAWKYPDKGKTMVGFNMKRSHRKYKIYIFDGNGYVV